MQKGIDLKIRVEKKIGDGLFWIETGELAKQAHGSCLIGYNDNVVLCATTTAPSKPGADFFPSLAITVNASPQAASSPAVSSSVKDAPASKKFSPPA